MKLTAKKFVTRLFKITGLSICSILLLLFLAPIVFPGTVAEKIKNWTNNSLDGEVNFSKARLSFFNHFPSLTLTLYDFSLKGSAPFKKDTLVATREIALGINLKSIFFEKSIRIDKIFLSGADINVQVNEKGEANYNVYVSGKNTSKKSNTDTAGAALKLEKIEIEDSRLLYNDQSVQMLIRARGLHYSGNGDLSEAIFDLYSHAKIDSLDFFLSNEPYLQNKSIDADLITKINTNSLAFFFQKNKLIINELPVQFSGKLDFLPNGYDIDFTVTSAKSDLHDVITALPQQYLGWLQKTKVKGTTDILLTLKGQYIASSNTMPGLACTLQLRDGYIAYKDAPLPVSNLYLNLDTKIPSLAPDSLQLKVDSLFFNVGKDYASAVFSIKGLTQPFINARVNTEIDLEQADKAFGFESVDLKGKYQLHLTANGLYARGPKPNSLRNDSMVVSIPSFLIQSAMKDGYIKYASLPQALTGINFNLNSSCTDNNYKHIAVSLNDLEAKALSSFIKGHASIGSLENMNVDAALQSSINLGEIKQFYPVDSLDMAGLFSLAVNSNGKYDAASKSFPKTTADIAIKNGSIRTAYYPNPVSNIQLAAKASDATGTLKDLKLDIEPASFEFEGKPFSVQASLQDFSDLMYRIKANGEIDLAKIYKVFSRKGIDVSGFIKADLSLQGRQSDAVQGRYSKLHNEGTLQLKDIATSYEDFPQPFIIKEGLFKFKQDKMWFNRFAAVYGQSDFRMIGYLQNVIDYALTGSGVLKGNFTVDADLINADEFMAFAPPATTTTTNPDVIQATQVSLPQTPETGVIIIPANLSMQLTANAKKVVYNGLAPTNVKSTVGIDRGKLSLANTGFNLIGCEVTMDASYGSTTPRKAFFDYHIQAKDFDIKKAYDEIKLFRDMASAAGKAQGIVSLDYSLKGVLDGNMHPIYPSLEGGGVLSIKNIKVKGFKLLSAVSKKTGKEGIDNPDLSKVDIKTTVKNNIVTLERLKLKIAGFRPRIEGQTSFDGKLNFKMRLGLPPFGIIGIPMHITGTQDNPKVKLGKNDKEELSETEYKEEGTEKN